MNTFGKFDDLRNKHMNRPWRNWTTLKVAVEKLVPDRGLRHDTKIGKDPTYLCQKDRNQSKLNLNFTVIFKEFIVHLSPFKPELPRAIKLPVEGKMISACGEAAARGSPSQRPKVWTSRLTTRVTRGTINHRSAICTNKCCIFMMQWWWVEQAQTGLHWIESRWVLFSNIFSLGLDICKDIHISSQSAHWDNVKRLHINEWERGGASKWLKTWPEKIDTQGSGKLSGYWGGPAN